MCHVKTWSTKSCHSDPLFSLSVCVGLRKYAEMLKKKKKYKMKENQLFEWLLGKALYQKHLIEFYMEGSQFLLN